MRFTTRFADFCAITEWPVEATKRNQQAGQTPRSMETSALHPDLIGNMKRSNSLFCSTAYRVLEAAGVLHETRLRKRSLDSLHIKE